MGKINVNSRDNYLSTNGIIDLFDSWLDQPLTTTSTPQFNGVLLTGNSTIGGDLEVTGNLTVGGSTTIIGSEVIELTDNIIEINSAETGAGVTLGSAGLEINRGSLTPYRIVFDEAFGTTRVGFVGDLFTVATRENAPLDKGIVVYDAVTKLFKSTQNVQLTTSFTSTENSVTSSSGAIRASGGIGVAGNISLDGALNLRGLTYASYIDADPLENVVILAGNNLNFVLSSGKSVTLPTNVNLSLDGGSNIKRVYATPTLVNIENTTGNVAFATSSGGSVVLPSSTYLSWVTNTNSIRYNGSDIVVASTGQFRSTPVFNVTNNTTSTSSSIGSVITSGGFSSSNLTDAVSSLNGGGLTLGGGAGISKTLYVGGKAIFGDTTSLETQVAGRGINLRSLARTLTTSNSVNTDFNSFEGGIVDTSSTISRASTLYIENSPSVTGGGSIVNSYSLYVNNGTSYIGGILESGNTTASTSTVTAAVKLSGGISINNSTNATSYVSGGTITTDGGIGVRGDVYLGGKIDVGALGVSLAQVQNQGINLRSRDRVLTTVSATNTTFNSFEGGSISSSATIPIASTVSITGPPQISGGGVLTNSYALHILNGVFYSADTTASTSSSIGSAVFEGGLSIKNTTDATSFATGGSLTSAGGAAIGKNLYVGGNTVIGSGNPIVGARVLALVNTSNNSSSFSIMSLGNDGASTLNIFLNSSTRAIDGGANTATIRNDAGSLRLQGSTALGLNIASTGVVTSTNTTASTSNSTGGFIFNGGIGIIKTTNATSATNGGTFTTAGGIGVAQDAYIGGMLDVNGITNLDRTNIDTTDGIFSVTGPNAVDITVGSASNFTTTSGSVTIDSQAGTLVLDGHTGVTIDSATSGISIDAAGASNFSTTTGTMTISGIGTTITGTTGKAIVTGDDGVEIQTTSTTNGVKLATDHPAVPIIIGNAVSEVTIADNLTVVGDLFVTGTTTTSNTIVSTTANNSIIVNFSPVGTSDGGLVMRRFQNPNDGALGDVIQDPPKETGVFGANSVGNNLTLDATASSVDDYYVGWWILVTSGAGEFQARRIFNYIGATKVATIYATADNAPPTIVDGLDLTTPVSTGDSYSLFDGPYQGVFYDESLDLFKFAAVASAPESGEFPTTTSLTPLLLKQIYVDDPFPQFKGTIIDYTNSEAFLVRKVSDGGDVFTVNTTAGEIYISNPIDTISSNTGVFFKGLDTLSAPQNYSAITSTIVNNVAGNLISTLSLKVQNDTEGLTDFLQLKGGTSGNSFIDITSSVDSLRILNNTASTSSTSGVLLLSGGMAINLATDASSTTSGGSFTTTGGMAIGLKLFVGGDTTITSTSSINATTNGLTGTEAAFNINGDVGLYNATGSKIIFNNVGSGAPTFTSRSTGTKIVLLGEISGSSADFAFGINSDTLWYSTPTTSDSHIFYTGTTGIVSISSSGISTLQAGSEIAMFNGSTTAKFKESSGATLFIPHDNVSTSGLQFRDSTNSNTFARINGNGQLSLALSPFSASPQNGTFLNINAQTFTDNSTSASGTATINSFVHTGQSTLAALNVSVTTTNAINSYIGGAPIRGTNQTFTNAYGVYVDSSSDITSLGTIDTAASIYIKNSPTAGGTGVITNPYALFVDDGTSRFDGKIVLPTTTLQVPLTQNTFTTDPGSLNVYGDIVLRNSTRQGIYFSQAGLGLPSLTNRSAGSKLILYPGISPSSADTAIGVGVSVLWYGVPSSVETHDFYFGTNRRYSLTNTGIRFDTASSVLLSPNTTDGSDTKGVIITGGGSTGITRGAQIEIYGNEINSGSLELKTGSAGEINLSTNGNERLSVLNTGEVIITSTTDSTGTGTGALRVSGGANIDLSLFVGTNFTLDFNQAYEFVGDVAGRLNIISKSSGISSGVRFFTTDSDNTDNNFIEIFGLSGGPNVEFIRMGYSSSSTEYIINTLATGTGTARNLVLSTGSNTNQLRLLNNGNISISSTTASTSVSTGSFVTPGGIGIGSTTNATSATNGGALTVGGGVGIGLDAYVGGLITGNNGLTITTGTSTLGGNLLFSSNAFIGRNTSDAADTGFLTLSGGGADGDTRGGRIVLSGNERVTFGGKVEIIAGNTSSIDFYTSSAIRATLNGSGNLGLGTSSPLTRLSLYHPGTNTENVTPKYNFGMEVRNTHLSGPNSVTNMILFTDASSTQAAIGGYRNNVNSDFLGGLLFLVGSQPGGFTGAAPSTITQASNSLTEAMRITPQGVVSISSAQSSTSASVGALVIPSGGLAVGNSANATSTTNGGALTVGGGAAILKDTYIGGNLYVSGSTNLTSPSITVSNTVNITGTPSIVYNKNVTNGTLYTLTINFTVVPTAANIKTSFEFSLPARLTNFTNVYDVNLNPNGYYGTTTPEAVENITGFGVVGSTRCKVQFTSSSTGTHVVQLTVSYEAV